jgi:DNA-binding NarL/FixJ family response regulator
MNHHTAQTHESRPARILIVDDHPLVREGLTARINSQPDMQTCGEAESVTQALAAIKATSPDLVVVDLQLADSRGMDLIAEIHRRLPKLKMLVVSAFDESLYAERVLRAGAHGYINKRELQDQVIEALRTVLQGHRYLNPAMTQCLLARAVSHSDPVDADPVSQFTDRELEVFQLLGAGHTNRQVAAQLDLSSHTVDTHLSNIRHKLGLKHTRELLVHAVQWKIENG